MYLVSTQQFDFLQHRSTLHQILVFLASVYKSFDQGSQVNSIYLDLCKAFNTVPHNELLVNFALLVSEEASGNFQVLPFISFSMCCNQQFFIHSTPSHFCCSPSEYSRPSTLPHLYKRSTLLCSIFYYPDVHATRSYFSKTLFCISECSHN